jgi:hypothetical protein
MAPPSRFCWLGGSTSGQQQLPARHVRCRVDKLRRTAVTGVSGSTNPSTGIVPMSGTSSPPSAAPRHHTPRYLLHSLPRGVSGAGTSPRQIGGHADNWTSPRSCSYRCPGEVQASSDAVSTASLPKEFEPTCVISSLENQLRGRVPGMVREPLMSGFPPSAESRVTLANWQDPPYNRWSFQHLRELIPTQRISRGHGHSPALAQHGGSPVLDDITAYRLPGTRPSPR